LSVQSATIGMMLLKFRGPCKMATLSQARAGRCRDLTGSVPTAFGTKRKSSSQIGESRSETKIRWCTRTVWVRVPPGALYSSPVAFGVVTSNPAVDFRAERVPGSYLRSFDLPVSTIGAEASLGGSERGEGTRSAVGLCLCEITAGATHPGTGFTVFCKGQYPLCSVVGLQRRYTGGLSLVRRTISQSYNPTAPLGPSLEGRSSIRLLNARADVPPNS